MSCTPVADEMRRLLDALQDWPAVDVDRDRESPEWVEARQWGWVMESGELTGTGLAHAKALPGGLLRG